MVERVDTPGHWITRQGGVVFLRVVTEQGQTKAATALKRTVTGSGIAAHAAQNAHDVAFEVHGLGRRGGDASQDPDR